MSVRKTYVTILLVIIGIGSGFGKLATVYALADGASPQVTTSRFAIFTDFSDKEALKLADHLSQLHAYYNRIFNFDSSWLRQEKLTVRYFATKNTFDSYLMRTLGRTYPSFVFLDYDDPVGNELLIYAQATADFNRALAHFSLVQFLEAYVPMAPIWIREGYALYFENSFFNADRETVVFQENDEWLETLQEIVIEDRLIDFERFFGMDERQARENQGVFYAQAWGVVSFLVSYRKRGVDKVVQEISAALQPNASQQANVDRVLSVLQTRFDFSTFEADFREYILAKKSISSLIIAAIEHYNDKGFEDAERVLYNVIGLDENNPTPYYYLGLIYYDRSDYKGASHYYVQALIRGAPEGTVYYALGLNALADEDRLRALSYFDQARAIDPTLFGKIDAALRRSY